LESIVKHATSSSSLSSSSLLPDISNIESFARGETPAIRVQISKRSHANLFVRIVSFERSFFFFFAHILAARNNVARDSAKNKERQEKREKGIRSILKENKKKEIPNRPTFSDNTARVVSNKSPNSAPSLGTVLTTT
jgi:hypothetical protein